MTKGEKIAAAIVVDILSALFICGFVSFGLWQLGFEVTFHRVVGIMSFVFATQVGLAKAKVTK